ncbi:MAG: Ig-like domain-containing protein [Minisyncoccia bacterium]
MHDTEFLHLKVREWLLIGCAAALLVISGVALTDEPVDPMRQSATSHLAQETSTNTTASGTTIIPVPMLPAYFYATGGECGSHTILLSWGEGQGITQYKVMRNGATIYQGLDREFKDTSVIPGTGYRYDLGGMTAGGMLGPLTRTRQAPGPCVEADTTNPPGGTGSAETSGSSGTTQTTEVTESTSSGNTGTQSAPPVESHPVPILIVPSSTFLYPGETLAFSIAPGPSPSDFVWKTLESKGRVSATGMYQAPTIPGVYRLLADARTAAFQDGVAVIQVIAREGENLEEGEDTSSPTLPSLAPKSPVVSPTPKPAPAPLPRTGTPLKFDTTPPLSKATNEVAPTIAPVIERSTSEGETNESSHEPLPHRTLIQAERLRIVANLILAKGAAIEGARADLTQLIDTYADAALTLGDEDAKKRIMEARTSLVALIEERLQNDIEPKAGTLHTLADTIVASLQEADLLPSGEEEKIRSVTANLVSTTETQTDTLEAQGAGLLYKDSNNDGISDYESERVYGLDPLAPSPTSEYEGRRVTAAEKLLLGFNPAEETLVKVVPEEPQEAEVRATEAYKVEHVALTEEKNVTLSGHALPNSFITVFIYSTPVIVTVKTDADGVWSYTLDKEIEDGTHTVYTATVNTSGKILARSQGYLFTKTAQAATLDSIAPELASGTESAPRLLGAGNLYLIFGVLAAVFLIMFIMLGLRPKEATPPPPAS